MILSEAIKLLEKLKEKHGDVTVEADCPFCGKSFACDVVVLAPATAMLVNVTGKQPQ